MGYFLHGALPLSLGGLGNDACWIMGLAWKGSFIPEGKNGGAFMHGKERRTDGQTDRQGVNSIESQQTFQQSF